MSESHRKLKAGEMPELRRRAFLVGTTATAAAVSLVAAYGTFASYAVRYLYPGSESGRRWLYVNIAARMKPGDSMPYRTPGGALVVVTRRGDTGTAEDFVAMSSVCPHLGCKVHWEAQNNYYFCPCHNGVFDADGRGIGGPPGDAKQSLSRYPLKIEGGLLLIEVSVV